MKIIPIKGDYIVDIRTGILYKKLVGINPRFRPHTRNNRVTTFYAKFDVYNEFEERKNITTKQIQKSIAGVTTKRWFKVFENYDLARLTEARIYIDKYPRGRYSGLYARMADEIIERVGKDNPEWVL